MRTHSAVSKVRFTVRIRTDIKSALEELQMKRDQQFNEVTIAELLVEGALLLLEREGIPVNGNSAPVPPHKPVRSAMRRTKAGAA